MDSLYQPVIIIGAARSGTKLVRDVIATHSSVEKVPYDVNYIWRFGNEDVPHDELHPDTLTPAIKEHIRKRISAFYTGKPFLVEKTVSNCLRVPFVRSLFPKAKFVYVHRNGEDVIESMYRQWLAKPEWRYIFRKALTFPLLDAFGYGLSYARQTFQKVIGNTDKAIGTWGPRYLGIASDLSSKDLWEVCAIQWARSVDLAAHSLMAIADESVVRIDYEDFVIRPGQNLEHIAEFLGIDPRPYFVSDVLSVISASNIGKGRNQLTAAQRALIQPYIERAEGHVAAFPSGVIAAKASVDL